MVGLRFTFIILLSAFWATGAKAQYSGASAASKSGGDTSGLILKMMTLPEVGTQFQGQTLPFLSFALPTNDSASQQQVLESLVGSSVEAIPMPNFPRVWWRSDLYT